MAFFTKLNIGKGFPLQRLVKAQIPSLNNCLLLVLSMILINGSKPPDFKILSLY